MVEVKRLVLGAKKSAKSSRVKKTAPAPTEAATADATPSAKGAPAEAIVIEIPSSPDYSVGAKRSSKKKSQKSSALTLDLDDEIEMWTLREKQRLEEDCQILAGDPLAADESSKKKSQKSSALTLELDDEIEMWTLREKQRLEEDCQILAGDPLAADGVVPAATAAAGNDDIAVVAERGKVACRDYPHPRSACAKNPFNTTPHERHCDKCFCYVCDVAAPCGSWKGTGGHCHASDKDKSWKTMRLLRQKQKT